MRLLELRVEEVPVWEQWFVKHTLRFVLHIYIDDFKMAILIELLTREWELWTKIRLGEAAPLATFLGSVNPIKDMAGCRPAGHV